MSTNNPQGQTMSGSIRSRREFGIGLVMALSGFFSAGFSRLKAGPVLRHTALTHPLLPPANAVATLSLSDQKKRAAVDRWLLQKMGQPLILPELSTGRPVPAAPPRG